MTRRTQEAHGPPQHGNAAQDYSIAWHPGLGMLGALAKPGIQALTRALIPGKKQKNDAQVLLVANAVEDKIKLMPVLFAAPFLCLTIAFDWLAILRFGRHSHSLPSADFVRYLGVWEQARIGAFGQMVLFYKRLVPFIHYSGASRIAETTDA